MWCHQPGPPLTYQFKDDFFINLQFNILSVWFLAFCSPQLFGTISSLFELYYRIIFK